jgi:Rrf2 family transcriptional regulator, nitric oxide-sensitive transcriptional repressor
MRLTRHTDYAMRVLLYLGARPDRLGTIPEMAKAYGISQNHLMKVVHQLGKAGYVTSVRGRLGGVRLARDARAINIGAVIRASETQAGADGLALLDCPQCPIAPACGLTSVVDEALAAFFAVLERHTLADLLDRRIDALLKILAARNMTQEI